MTFSDEDLKRLKDGLDESDDWEAFNFNCVLMPKDIKALLARLEAAEKAYETAGRVIDSKSSFDKLLKADNAWRKAAGK